MKLATVARRLRLDDETVRRFVTSGQLHASRDGRRWDVSEDDLARFITASRIEPGTLNAARTQETP